MGLEKLDGEEAEYDRMREALESLPFLASRKLVVLRAPSANKVFIEQAEKLLTGLPETTDLIVYEPKLDKRSVYYKLLKKVTQYQEFNELDENTLVKWLADEAKQAGGSLNTNDARYLIDRLGTDQQLVVNELQKLLTYEPNITRQQIDLLTEPTPQSTIFQLLDAAFAGQQKRMMELYKEQRAARVEPQQIIAMLAWQLHVLALVKTAGDKSEADVATEARLNPFVVRKSRGITNRLSLAALKDLIHHLAQLDKDLKTKSIDADDAVQAYLLSLSSG